MTRQRSVAAERRNENVEARDRDEQTSTDSPSEGDTDNRSRELDERKEDELPLDQVFEVLKNRRRREVIHYLDSNGGNASLSDLAEHIAAIENDTTVKALSSKQRKRVYVGLYQCHLPKMDSMDVIDFDKNRGTVELASNTEQVRSYLEESHEREWHKLYLSLTAGGGVLFLISQAGAAQYGLRPAVILLLLLVGLGICATAHALGRGQ